MVAEKGAPLRVHYRIACDQAWRTRTVEIEEAWQGEHHALRLEHDGQVAWRRDGNEAPELDGCTDVDLGITPSTNALPVNRLRLPVSGRGEIVAAWVRFPGLQVTSIGKSYERIAEMQYRYTSKSSGFTAIVKVDADGLPTDYSSVWRRVAEGPAAPRIPLAGFAGALSSSGPSTELGAAANDFGWLVGGWRAEVRDIDADGHALVRVNGGSRGCLRDARFRMCGFHHRARSASPAPPTLWPQATATGRPCVGSIAKRGSGALFGSIPLAE